MPRRRAEASRELHLEGSDTPLFLECLSREIDAINPLARFNLGVTRAAEGDQHAVPHHFLLCVMVQPRHLHFVA